MKIVIDARMYQEAGVGRYISNLINELQKLDQQSEYFILLLKKDFEKLEFQNNFKKVLADFRWYGVSEQIRLPKLLEDLKPDLVHFPHFNVPIFYKRKFVVTIHDLIHQHFSMQRVTTHGPLIYKIKQFGYRKIFNNAIKNAEKILVPSNFVKKQLINEGVNKDKIIVTYEAVDDKILSIGNNLSLSKENYIFYVGNAHPHKNVEGLIKAFLNLKFKIKNLKLVLAGHDHYFWQRIKKEFQNKDIIYKGYVTDEELVTLYKNARCFVMPSFEEGFGIPLLEAMVLSCPVVSSNAGSLPEVGGDAAIYFDPTDMTDMTNKIEKMVKSESLRKEMIKKGLKRYKMFSWKKLAKQTLEVYENSISS